MRPSIFTVVLLAIGCASTGGRGDRPAAPDALSADLADIAARAGIDPVPADAEAMTEALAATGWLDARVEVVEEAGVRGLRCDLGERYRVTGIRFEGNAAVSADDLAATVGIPGVATFYTREAIEQVREQVVDRYAEAGYLAAVEVTPAFDRADHTATLVARIVEGEVRTVRTCRVKGDTETEPWLLWRRIRLRPGERLDRRRAEEDAGRLRETGWFKRVDSNLEPVGDREADCVHCVEQAQTGSVVIGGGYTQDDDLAYGLVRIAESNFSAARALGTLGQALTGRLPDRVPRGGGERLDLSGREGNRIHEAAIEWEGPVRRWERLGLKLSAFRRRRTFDEYSQDEVDVRPGVGLDLVGPWSLSAVAVMGFARLVDLDEDAPAAVRDTAARHERRGVALGLGADRWAWTPSPWAWRTDLGYEFMGGPMGGVDLSSASAEAAVRRRVAGTREADAHAIFLDLRGGWVEAHTGTDVVPVAERLFAGGGQGPRGFDFRTVGPRVGGAPVGGTVRALATAGYQFPVFKEAVRGQVFADAGTVAEDVDHLRGDRVRMGAGFGIRWDIRADLPIEASVAFPVEKEAGDDVRWLGLGIGTSF